MKKILLIGLVLGLLFIVGCSEIDVSQLSDEDLERIGETLIVCENPYMRFESGCCLDQDFNSICDDEIESADETIEESIEQEIEVIDCEYGNIEVTRKNWGTGTYEVEFFYEGNSGTMANILIEQEDNNFFEKDIYFDSWSSYNMEQFFPQGISANPFNAIEEHTITITYLDADGNEVCSDNKVIVTVYDSNNYKVEQNGDSTEYIYEETEYPNQWDFDELFA
jgi:hypothetical protein